MIYEVNCMIPASRRDEFLGWLELHVKQLLRIDGFEDATISCLNEDERLPDEHAGFCVQYFLKDSSSFDHYLQEHASTMRQDGLNRFGSDLKIYRRLLSSPVFSSQ
ncbi:DUF4286 family protein [Endozoicomonas montiporae]|uniref:DUF4286 domain-containing protein n=1 Tax=Endozoicomonas montiporae CL-33 TaxID=570277 RepID=A0A142BAU9_9GAMM|nr:DUF4286 family protein [Endozoicomonas montiporae]AMO55875.1 hypothetical protein EZMO1_1726 [Endozoicomonas montiporae CL-33]